MSSIFSNISTFNSADISSEVTSEVITTTDDTHLVTTQLATSEKNIWDSDSTTELPKLTETMSNTHAPDSLAATEMDGATTASSSTEVNGEGNSASPDSTTAELPLVEESTTPYTQVPENTTTAGDEDVATTTMATGTKVEPIVTTVADDTAASEQPTMIERERERGELAVTKSTFYKLDLL